MTAQKKQNISKWIPTTIAVLSFAGQILYNAFAAGSSYAQDRANAVSETRVRAIVVEMIEPIKEQMDSDRLILSEQFRQFNSSLNILLESRLRGH